MLLAFSVWLLVAAAVSLGVETAGGRVRMGQQPLVKGDCAVEVRGGEILCVRLLVFIIVVM